MTQTRECVAEADRLPERLATLLTLMRARRSVRRYVDRPIARPLLEALLEAATWAPSAHNRQPWRFAVVESATAKEHLAAQMAVAWRRDLAADGLPAATIEQRVAISTARITGAAALVMLALNMAQMDSYPDARRADAEWTMAVQSTALAGQNLLLAAHAAGLAACWMCAPLFVPEVVRDALALPPEWQPQALITLGYPAEEKQKTREPLESRILWR
ncbi:MAG: nitroreductase family protein [Caldilineaceae bacterium]